MNTNASFEERLEIGNDKEYYVNDILNLSGVPSRLNNLENVKDIDLYLSKDNLYMDVKYIEQFFRESKFYTDMEPEDCLIIDKRHIQVYEQKRLDTGIDVWVAFLVNFESLGIFELRFIRTEDILKLIKDEKALVRPIKERGHLKMKINLNKNDCLNMIDFLMYINNQRINQSL
jgi:hypothetical protein